MSKDNLSSLYNGLIKKGYSVEDIGDEATFRTKMADKNNRKQLYDYVSSRGDFRIGDYDSYEKRLSSAQEEIQPQQAEKPLPKARRQSLREQVGGGMAIAVPDDVEMAAKFADSPQVYDPNANIQRALAEGKLDTIINEDEEKRISAEFKPKPVVNPADIYENYSNRFSLTERGKELSSELAGISQEIQNRYANEFLSSNEFKNLQKQYKGEELDKKANETFSRAYSDKIDNELQPYVKAYQNEAFSRYGLNIQDELAAYSEKVSRNNKDKIASDVSSLDKSVNAQLEENHRKLSAKAGSGGSAFNALMASASYNAGSAQDRKAKAELEAARQLVDESNNIISEARKKGKTNFVAGLGRGLSDAVFDANTWSFGLQDMRDASVLVDALDKFDRGEALTESEQTLMDAAVANMAVNAYYYSDLGRGYKAGSVSGQSIPFMLEFAINPVSASGSAIAKNVLKYGMKKFGKSAVKNNAAKFAARLVGDAAAAATMTGTSSAARVAAGAMERAGGDIQLDESGTGYAGREGQMGTGEALGKSFASTFLENQSEMVFNAFSGLGSKIWRTAEKYVPGGTAAIMDNAVMGKAGEIYRKIKSNPTLKEVARRTQFHGLGEEYLEEVYNNFANIPLGEMTLEEATDLDNNIDTFLGLAPTSVAFGIIGLGGLAAQKAEHRKKLKAAFGNMTRIEKNRLAKLEELAEKGGNEDIKMFIRETMLDTSLSPEEKKAEIEYAYNLAVGNAIDDVEAAQQEEVAVNNAAASEEGAAIYAEHNPETMRQTVLRREVAEQRLVDAGFSIDKLKATPVNERQELLSRIDEENTQLVVDYFDAYDREEAMNEALDTAHEEEVSQARSMLQDIVLPNRTVTVVPLGQYGTEQAQYGVVVSGIDAQGNPTQSNGAVVTYPVQIVNGTPDFSTIDKDNAIVTIPKSYTDAMVFSPDEAFNGMLTAYQQDAAILEGTPIVPGAQFPVMLDDGSMQNVTVAGTAPTGESVVVLPDGKTVSMTAEELSTRKRNAELAPIMAEQAEEEQIQQQAVQEAATAGYSDEVRNLQPQAGEKLVVNGRNAAIKEVAPDGIIVDYLSEGGDITGTDIVPLETYYDYKQSQFNQQNNVQAQSDKDTAVSGSVPEEPVEGDTADSSGDTTATEEVQQAEEKDYPVDEAGEPAFLQMQPQRTVQLLTDTFAEDAASFVSDRLSAAQKAAEKAAKKSPKALRFNERAKELSRIRQEREDAAREVEYWQNISSLIAPEVQPQQTEQPQQVEEKPKPKAQAQPSAPSLMEQAEEISRKNQERLAAMTEEEIAAAQKKVQENIDKGKYDRKPASRRRSRYNDEDVAMGEAYTPMEHVLREIATGRITFQWGDSKLGGTQGLGSHLGLSGSNAERQKLIWALSGEGYAPEVAAEIIHADMPSAMQELVTDQDVFNMILDAFSQYGSPSRMFEAAQQLHGIDMESQPGYEEDMERQQLEWEAYHNNMSVKDWTTLVDIVEEELEYQFQTLTDEDINAIFEEIYNEEYGTGRNEIEGAEGTEQSADSEGSNEVQPQQQSDNETADGRSEVRPEETAPSDEQGSGTLSQPGFTVEKRYHKKDNKDIFAVNFTERMDRDIFLDAKNEAKNRGGYYSSFGKGGFIFETEEAARNFGELIMAGIVGRNVGRAIEAARAQVEQNPTEAQKEAGNYRKGHITIDGYNITLENPKGGYMAAEFDETNLPKVLNRLSNLGVKVADKAKLKDAKDEDIRFRTEDSEIRFRSSSDLVVDISEDLESLINEKPVKREPTYNADNIGSIFYSMSGKYMKRLPQPKDRHVLTEGTIDIDKAIEVYNKVLPVYEDMKNELIGMIPDASMAARREIAAYIEAINNNIDYYKELSEGKDVWRTRPLYRFEEEYGLTEEVTMEDIERFDKMVPNHPEIYIVYTEDDLMSLKEAGVGENEIQDIIENALDNPNVGGVFMPKSNMILMFPSKAIDERSFEACLWHENSHYVLHNSKSINYERLTDDCLMYLKDKYPENYNIIIKGYPKEHWNEEGITFLMQKMVDENGPEKIINAKFEGNDNISRLFTTILNEFKDETKRRGTVRNKLRHVQAEASDGKREENNGNDGGRRSGKPEAEPEVGRKGENESERTRQERIKSFITEQAAKLNIPVTVYTSIDEIPQGAARRALERGLPVKGWYHDGQIAIYLPNATGMEDIKATLLHEGVAHYGLRKMIGEENFNAFMDGIYAAASPEVRKEIVRLLPKYNYNMRTAVEEYLATLAESGTIEPTFWEKVKQLFRSILENLGFTIELTDNDLRYLLWESRNNLRASNSPIDVAKETMMRKKLGIGMFRTKDTEHVESKEKQGIVEKAKADGTYMKAPNGKSSNLNERQWVQVRTKAFKNWFGDWENNAENASKVVDENGEPKVVQHGTPIEELYEFDINHLGDNTGDEGVYGAGFYFGNLDEEGFSIYGDNIIQAYLNIRSPYNIDADSDILDFIASLNFASMREVKFKGQSKENSTIGELIDYINEVKNKYDIGDYSDLIESFRGIFGESADEEVIMRKISLKFAFPLSVNTFINDCIGGIDFTKALKRNGNDGVIVWSRKDYSELVAFYPTQIKSATDNTGNFNPENPDIRFRFEQRPALIKSYDAAIDNSTFRFQEAFQDSMLSLKVLQELIEEQSGMKARSFENAYTAENRLSSVNKVDNERYLENFFKPLLEQIDKLAKMSDRKSVEDYIYAKSGLERNELFLNREADKILNEKTKELDESLATSSITQKQYEKELKELEEARDKFIAAGKDYSGLTGLVLKEYEDELNSMPDEAARAKREKEIEKEYKNHAENIVSEFENLIPSAEVDKLWQLIKAANDENLRKQFDSGMLSAEKYEELRDMMPHYVPLRGWQESIAEDFYDYTRKESPVQKEKSAKGRKSLADNPIANIALSAQNAIILGNRNKMKQRFFNFVVNRPNELVTIRDQWYAKTIHTVHDQMEPVYPDIKETDDSATIQRKLEDFENDMKSLEEQGLARRKRMPLGVELKMKSGQKPEHMVSVMINGQEYVMYINGNPRAAQALNGKTNPEGEENIFWEYYNKAKRLYGGGLTSNNPDFVAANFVRDSIHSATMQFLNNGFGSSARFVLNTPKSFKAVFRGVLGKYKPGSKTDQYFQEFIQNGGETGYTAIHTIEDYKREYEKALNEVKGFKVVASAGKKGLEGVIKALEVANRIAEDVNRFNAYMSSREAGKTIEESIDAAKNITVNFNKKGALGKGKGAWAALAWFMNKWILFFNPAVQGLYQVGQSAANNKKRVAGTLATIAASGFIMPYLNALLVSAFGGDDKDDYFYQTDYTRMNNWLIFTGNGYAKIPLPPFFREIYGMGDVFYRLMTNRITPERAAVATLRQLQSAIGFINLIPEGEPNIKEAVSGIMPDLIAPLMDVALNRDFTGRDIAKDTEWTKNLPEYERIYKGVSPVYVEFSRMLNQIGGDDARRSPLFGTFINPAYMEHLITSYTGGIGRTISNLTGAAVDLATGEADNIEFRTIPIINRFGSPVTERSITASVNRVFYDYLERYEAMKVAEKRYKEFIKDGRTEYRDELEQMKSNGESELIRYFDMKMKTVRKLQNILKDNPDNKKVEQRIIELKSEMILKAKNILK